MADKAKYVLVCCRNIITDIFSVEWYGVKKDENGEWQPCKNNEKREKYGFYGENILVKKDLSEEDHKIIEKFYNKKFKADHGAQTPYRKEYKK